MAHWAKINDAGIVEWVVVGNDSFEDGGYQFLVDTHGGKWIKCSYNTIGGVHLSGGTPLRKNYPSIGYSYDESMDAFIPPRPNDSSILDSETCLWIPVEGVTNVEGA